MNKFVIFMAGVMGLAITQTAMGQQTTQSVCYGNTEFMKYIDDQKLITIYNGQLPDNKVQDVLMSRDRRIITVVYDKSQDGNALGAKQYCVTSIIDNVSFNDVAIEFLNSALEKAKGQKT